MTTQQHKAEPALRFSEFSDDWIEKEIGAVCEVKTGNKDTQNRVKTGKYPFFVRSNTVERINSYAFDGEAILTSGDGVGVGKNFHYINGKFDFHQRVYALRNFDESISGKFVYSIFSERFYRRVMRLSAKNSVDSVRMDMITKMKVFYPPLPEQQKIAAFLSSVDTKIEQLGKKKALLEQYKKGMMQKLFSQEIRFKDEQGNDYPEWEEKRLADIDNLIHGDGDWILSQDISKNGQYEIVQLGNIGLGLFIEKPMKTISADKFDELGGTKIFKGDLLINRMVDNKLYCCILNKNGDFVTSVDVCWIRPNEVFDNYYLMNLILYTPNQHKLLNLSSGSGRVRISKKNLFGKFSFLLPTIKEQQKIANFLSAIDQKIELVGTELEKARTFKKGLLQQMFI